jgi:hypothetical protein
MFKFAALIAMTFVSQIAFASAVAQTDKVAGDYRKDEQHDVYITKLTDKPGTYFVTIFLVSPDKRSCYFENEMKLSSGGLVHAEFGCAVGITKNPTSNMLSVVGSCPAHCTGGMDIIEGGFKKTSDVEPMSSEDLNKGD